MTRISSLRTAGFKGIDELEVNPSSINIITGRNNTGKTSFLESINTVFNPNEISSFSENLDKVINVNSVSCSISAKYTKEQQTLSNNFDEPNPEVKNRELAIREPRDRESVDIFTQALQDIVEINEEYPVRVRRPPLAELADAEQLEKLFQDTLEEEISTLSKDIILPNARDNVIILEIGGKDYPYIHLGQFYDEIRDYIVSEAIPVIESSLDMQEELVDLDEDSREEVEYFVERGLREQLVPRFGSDRFVGEEPPSIPGVRMVESPILSSSEVDMNKPNAAVKVSNIEEYLKENEILEGIDDFSFEKIVYKTDNDKDEIPYSFMGDGFKTLVGILWEVMSDERSGNVLLLEEPDVHMHPGYIENLLTQLVTLVRKNNIQLFITSHNLDLIEGFFSDSLKAREGDFLEDHFKLIQLTEPVPRTIDYDSAQDEVEELNVDLRGI